jgi:gamma-glutamyl hydrolase
MRTARRKRDAPLCVGILTVPHLEKTPHGKSHIMNYYVDWFENCGVRVVPIPYQTRHPERYYSMVNGLFIPGGYMPYVVKQSAFWKTLRWFVEKSLEPSEYFPIWGTCLGFEFLMFLIGGLRMLKRHEIHKRIPIQLTDAAYDSRMMGSFPSGFLRSIQTQPVFMQNHEYGISPRDFLANPHLRRFYRILATARDMKGKEFVCAIEAIGFPIYGVQILPEYPTPDSHLIGFLISELKKNRHRPPASIPFLRSVMRPYPLFMETNQEELLYYFF